MVELLGLVLLSFIITSFFMVPFIDGLFYIKRKYKRSIPKGYDQNAAPIHNKLLQGKDTETPVGGGILLIILVTIFSVLYANSFNLKNPSNLYIILFTFVSFGLIGLID